MPGPSPDSVGLSSCASQSTIIAFIGGLDQFSRRGSLPAAFSRRDWRKGRLLLPSSSRNYQGGLELRDGLLGSVVPLLLRSLGHHGIERVVERDSSAMLGAEIIDGDVQGKAQVSRLHRCRR